VPLLRHADGGEKKKRTIHSARGKGGTRKREEAKKKKKKMEKTISPASHRYSVDKALSPSRKRGGLFPAAREEGGDKFPKGEQSHWETGQIGTLTEEEDLSAHIPKASQFRRGRRAFTSNVFGPTKISERKKDESEKGLAGEFRRRGVCKD